MQLVLLKLQAMMWLKVCQLIFCALLYKHTKLVYYAYEDDLIPCTRSEVWRDINGIENGMDKNGLFIPENAFYHVVSIVLHG